MGTKDQDYNLAASLFGKTRLAVLSLLFSHTDEAFYLRQLSRTAGVGLGALQRELQQLSAAGVIRRRMQGRQVYFQANPDCPIFPEIKNLVLKTSGISDVLRSALAPLADRIQVAFIYGSIARGGETRQSDVDILVVGRVKFSEIAAVLRPAQETLRREVNPSVYPPDEFRSKLKENHHFLNTVWKGQKLFLIGDEHELARMAEKRLAD